jgi:hypothetical protein
MNAFIYGICYMFKVRLICWQIKNNCDHNPIVFMSRTMFVCVLKIHLTWKRYQIDVFFSIFDVIVSKIYKKLF